MVSLNSYLMLGAVLFSIGAVGVFTQRNALIIYMCIELMLNAVNLTIIAFARFLNSMDGHVFVFMIMTVAAAEAAVGLAIIISLFRNKATVNVDEINLSKG
ncbi:MAG: NADH-quinone oxidoreductase subunit K [Syntrophobacteraceae bacterium CG2_30_61_12]|nr:MAG: NADH-quinone oxidoreductase subunit K [Syntrophobacteraceae bacterium CG2_30_61_12]PIU32642.1 MAG: NADH-quinone oxidoreductase subunit NuoK [Syntrophobacteraceae bacterium CG07_land_8_20_14_0_80_61_8]